MDDIKLDDLKDAEVLSQQEAELLVGAGRPARKLGLETLERREAPAVDVSAGMLRVEDHRADMIRVVQMEDEVRMEGVSVQMTPGLRAAPSGSWMPLAEQTRVGFGDAGLGLVDLTAVAQSVVAGNEVDGVVRATESSREILFVDTRVPNYASLLGGVRKGIETVMLRPDADGVRQMAETLRGREGITTVHLVTHGSAGRLALGNTDLRLGNLDEYAAEWRSIGASLTTQADLLVYGCDVAAGEQGAAFVARLATQTGADVSASVNATGAVEQGGDWVLEASSGPIASDIAFGETVQAAYRDVLLVAGGEFRVNTTTVAEQMYSSVAMDASGNFVVAWMTPGQDGSGYGVYAQRYGSDGGPVGSEFRVNTFTASDQGYPAVAMSASGDFVITWQSNSQDGSGTGIFAQRYGSDGRPVGSEFRVNTFTVSDQNASAVAMDASGNFIITWQGYSQDGWGAGIFAQRYGSDGRPVGSEFRVNTTIQPDQCSPAVAMDGSGNFVISWFSYDQDGSGSGVYAQRYGSDGRAVGSEFRVNTTTADYQTYPAVAMDATGNFVIAWNSYSQDGSDIGVYAQRYARDGRPLGSEFRVNTTTADRQFSPRVAMDAAGHFVVSWMSNNQDGSGYGVYAQRYGTDGNPLASEFRVNTTTESHQYQPTVAMDAVGNFAVTWMSLGQDGSSWGIYGRLYRNQAPVDISLSNTTVQENVAVGSLVGTLSAADPDAGDTHTFALVGGDTWAFSITGNQLKLAVSPDYESKSSYGIRVRATDQEGRYTEKNFTIIVQNSREVLFVNTQATGANTGQSWANAYTTLQSALNAAVAGDEIWVARGTYKPSMSGDRTKTFALKEGVDVYGGFVGTETLVSQRNWSANQTILSGDIGVAGVSSDNSYHVVTSTGLTSATELDGFSVFYGNASGASVDDNRGGGMYNNASSPTLRNLVFSGNSATTEGGGMYNNASSPTVANVVFGGNAAQSGGAMANLYAYPKLTSVTFASNFASYVGGAIYNNAWSSPTLNTVDFTGNVAGAHGGGMSNLNNSSVFQP